MKSKFDSFIFVVLEGESQNLRLLILHSMRRQNLNKKSKIREIRFLEIFETLFFEFIKICFF